MKSARSFLQIMRDVREMRAAGLSVAVAVMSTLESDRDWQTVYDRLMSSAKLESALRRQERRHRAAKPSR